MGDFRAELVTLLNKHSMENESNSPDFVLANYMILSLDAFEQATRQRDRWYNLDTNTVPVSKQAQKPQSETK